jgi:nucleoside-diphosphate-sugar epimerase
VVFSLPGQLGSVASLKDPLGSVAESILPHLTLLRALSENGLKPTVVFPSSHLVYKEPSRCLYTAHKKTVEDYLRIYHRAYGIPYVVYRIATGYGPHQKRISVVNFFIKRALEGKNLPVYDYVQNDRLGIVYIDDMVAALALACGREDYKYHAYPLLAYQPRVVDIANAVADSLGGKVALVETPPLVKSVGSGDLLIEDDGPPGWIPKVGLEEGILKTAQWMRPDLTG